MKPWIFLRLRAVKRWSGFIIDMSVFCFYMNSVCTYMNIITVFAFNMNSVPSDMNLIFPVFFGKSIGKISICAFFFFIIGKFLVFWRFLIRFFLWLIFGYLFWSICSVQKLINRNTIQICKSD